MLLNLVQLPLWDAGVEVLDELRVGVGYQVTLTRTQLSITPDPSVLPPLANSLAILLNFLLASLVCPPELTPPPPPNSSLYHLFAPIADSRPLYIHLATKI